MFILIFNYLFIRNDEYMNETKLSTTVFSPPEVKNIKSKRYFSNYNKTDAIKIKVSKHIYSKEQFNMIGIVYHS